MNVTELAQAIRGGLMQRDRLLKTDIPSLPNNALVPRRAVARSELGRDFSVVLDLVSTASDIELKTLIAQPITLWIQQADKSYLPINGYIPNTPARICIRARSAANICRRFVSRSGSRARSASSTWAACARSTPADASR
ncbi:contractile injection system protein, VgrG/Pvc8 family [Burkholderia ambifaria]